LRESAKRRARPVSGSPLCFIGPHTGPSDGADRAARGLLSAVAGNTLGRTAGVAQLVERQLPKLDVEGSNPFTRLIVTRSKPIRCSRGPVREIRGFSWWLHRCPQWCPHRYHTGTTPSRSDNARAAYDSAPQRWCAPERQLLPGMRRSVSLSIRPNVHCLLNRYSVPEQFRANQLRDPLARN
jgi:hypothetical protein